MLKARFLLAMTLFLILAVSCKQREEKSSTGEKVTLELWSLTDELKTPIAEYEKRNLNVKINLTVIPNENYPTKLLPVLRSGKGAPDIFVGEAAYVRQWTDTPFWLNLSKEYPDELNTDKIIPYTVDIGKDPNGDVRALSWQATPGGSFIRRSYAKEFFGTDDPDELGDQIFASTDTMLAAARSVKEKSNGQVFMFSAVSDLFAPFRGQRNSPWVVNGKLVIDPAMIEMYQIAKIMYEEDLLAKTNQWTPAWFNGMKKDGNIFAYLLPTWGLHYVLKANAPDSSSDWVLTKSFSPWFWGGTWIGVYAKSAHKQQAWNFVKAMTQDNDFMTWYGKTTGDFLSNKEVVDKLKDDFSEPYLNGQNHYQFFSDQAVNIQANLTKYDLNIDAVFQQSVIEYVEGRVATVADALSFLRKEIKAAYPEIDVE